MGPFVLYVAGVMKFNPASDKWSVQLRLFNPDKTVTIAELQLIVTEEEAEHYKQLAGKTSQVMEPTFG